MSPTAWEGEPLPLTILSLMNALLGHRALMRLTVFICALNLGGCSNKGSSTSSGKNAPGGRVEVSGSTSDDDPTEFKQADESVQIGGVNLTGDQNLSSQYVIKAYLITAGGKVQIYSDTIATKSFIFSVERASSYVIVEVTNPSGETKSAVLAPSFAAVTVRANLVVNRITDIVAKMLLITQDLASKGDADAAASLSQYTLSVSDMLMLAASTMRVIDKQKNDGVAAEPINLTVLTRSLIQATVEKVNGLSAEYSPTEYAKKVAAASYTSVYAAQYSETTSPEVLAYRTNNDLGSSAAASADIAYAAIVSFQNPFVNVAYRAAVTGYRGATSSSAASSSSTESTIASTFETLYSVCQTVTTCTSGSFSAPLPPTDSSSYGSGSTGGTTSGPTGGSTGGTTSGTTGGSTSGSTSGSTGGTTGGGSQLTISSVTSLTSTLLSVAFSGGGSSGYTATAYTDANCSVSSGTPASGSGSPLTVQVPAAGTYYFKVEGSGEASACFGPETTMPVPPL
jgi:hypothetical protein